MKNKSTEIFYQRYRNFENGSIILFRKIRSGQYEDGNGKKISLSKLQFSYEYLGPAGKRKSQVFITNLNGFKVRLKEGL